MANSVPVLKKATFYNIETFIRESLPDCGKKSEVFTRNGKGIFDSAMLMRNAAVGAKFGLGRQPDKMSCGNIPDNEPRGAGANQNNADIVP